ncbi:hypothetical protein KUTeg_001583, partial [Tegillarca granosa]
MRNGAYLISHRTNNDVEGWYRRVNHKALGMGLPFTGCINSNPKKLVSEGKLSRYQRFMTLSIQARFYEIWDGYKNDNISASKLLRECGELNGPVISTRMTFSVPFGWTYC